MDYRDRDDSIRDRDKKSFSEIDKQRRDQKYKGGDRESVGHEKAQRSQAYSNYKRQLDKAFDGEGLPEAIKAKLGETEVGKKTKARKTGLAAIKGAQTPAAILESFVAYRDEHGFPEDAEVLARLLELEDEPEIVVAALRVIDRLADGGDLKRTSSLKMRIKTVQMTIDDDDVFAEAKALLKKL